jgi:hypothetical protein
MGVIAYIVKNQEDGVISTRGTTSWTQELSPRNLKPIYIQGYKIPQPLCYFGMTTSPVTALTYAENLGSGVKRSEDF